jgi:hypothetical protein
MKYLWRIAFVGVVLSPFALADEGIKQKANAAYQTKKRIYIVQESPGRHELNSV